ncbi:hypothetical protein QWY93_03870 [Echinicola jeungdonensis]|uniref:Uncharacterized protein n=1 Tax=Echinicola jeungdonensis TaxID=709343 RepID=A0ABV5J2T9_9BACT|nr:hypothetical protein [Echinicola jeungdonensis]MDN3668463.1 hypothetical protein [Echinicola jeungdonensis]
MNKSIFCTTRIYLLFWTVIKLTLGFLEHFGASYTVVQQNHEKEQRSLQFDHWAVDKPFVSTVPPSEKIPETN